ncbi:capsular polysaccharide biosynthesis protein [Microbacterium terrae]|uniref:Capsular polysaccharide biosynthesis protein n=1 Tax=Microbacterium terrae TaxID=69369 RepID=A0A0M2H3U0_9MICO|nr:hypothetical protein [Microbacterium terrae]KJL38470.1 hypothetical protein RS81_02744 [Microbacterium terrae]MBP1078887.1 capsular polysaccharide biosynthesis protein [Microbacterium terrae]GLJ98287.1 hypothetical protein GCM10017594_14840 [Microbacterium terrae]
MDVPQYLQILWRSKWLLLVGAVVAAVAAFFAGFTIIDGKVTSRAVQSYTATTTLLVSAAGDDMYQAVLPGQPLVEGQTQPETVDLTSKAILYAYIISGRDMRTTVEESLGEFSDTDSLTALRRTTQPGGDESFPGRYVLPILAVVGASLDPTRAEDIAATAAAQFQADVIASQDAETLPDADRVTLTVLDESPAAEVEGSNPAIPLVITFLGVFLLFVAAAFIIAGIRSRRSGTAAAPATEQADETTDEPAADAADSEDVYADDERALEPVGENSDGWPTDGAGDGITSRRGRREGTATDAPEPTYTG